jgi:4-hydroxybenzoate polyprenyltransferase
VEPMMNETSRPKIVVIATKYIRLDDVIKWCAIAFIGFIVGSLPFTMQEFITSSVVFLAAAFFLMAFTFAINNYSDADSDRENPRRMHHNAIASGEISKKEGMTLNILFIVLTLLITMFFKPVGKVVVLTVFLIVWFGIYSIPPFRIKGRPGFDVVWHFIAFFSIILWGSLFAGSLSVLAWLMALSLGIFSCVGQLWNHYADYEFDKKSGTKTFAVQVGLDKTKKTIDIVLALHLVVLLPLIILYISHFLITLLIMAGLMILGCLMVRPKKKGFPSRKSFEFYLATIVGGAVYISCLAYHVLFFIGIDLINIY